MIRSNFCRRLAQVAVFLVFGAGGVSSSAAWQTASPAVPTATSPAWQRPPATATAPPPAPVTRADILRGAYGPYRVNNDLLSYHLDIRVDPGKQTISGKNSIRFKMLQDGTRIQLDHIRRSTWTKFFSALRRSRTFAIPARCSWIFRRRCTRGRNTRLIFITPGIR